MDLILWRHAEAHLHPDPIHGLPGDANDLARRLTPRGEKQAHKMAAWLDRQLPEGVTVWSSPALRTEATALALGRKFRTHPALLPESDPMGLQALAKWPNHKTPVVLVGHQPTLGSVVAKLLGMPEGHCPIKKGGLWWLRHRVREDEPQTFVVAVMAPELL